MLAGPFLYTGISCALACSIVTQAVLPYLSITCTLVLSLLYLYSFLMKKATLVVNSIPPHFSASVLTMKSSLTFCTLCLSSPTSISLRYSGSFSSCVLYSFSNSALLGFTAKTNTGATPIYLFTALPSLLSAPLAKAIKA